MSAIILTDSVAMESKRKAFVRKFVERNMKRLLRPSRSKSKEKAFIADTMRDIIRDTRAGRMSLVAEANFQWQKQQLREHFNDKPFISYADLKQFIHERGWDRLWFGDGNRLRGYWLSICRHGRM